MNIADFLLNGIQIQASVFTVNFSFTESASGNVHIFVERVWSHVFSYVQRMEGLKHVQVTQNTT